MQKKISFKNSKGQRLVGILHIPQGKGPFPAVILLHGLSSNYNDKIIHKIASTLEKEGVIALRFSLTGHGGSDGSYKNILASQFVNDVKSAIGYLSKDPKVSQQRVAVLGHSIGGVTALLAASKFYKQLVAVISISAFIDVKLLIELNQGQNKVQVGHDYFNLWGLKITNKHFEDKLYENNKKIISDIHCPTLIIHGEKDKTVEVRDALLIYNLLEQPKRLKIIKGADHNFTNQRHLDQVISGILKWFKEYLIRDEFKVITAVLEYKDKILLLKRSQKVGTSRGYWSGVGGHMDKHETVIKTAKREVFEELGIKAQTLNNYKVSKSFKYFDKKHDKIWHVHPVLFKLTKKPKIKLNWEHDEYRWVTSNQIKRFKTISHFNIDLKNLGLIK